eukprot:2453280-Rhodomonas_salina.1
MGGNYGESFSDLEIAVSKHAEGSIEAAEQGYTKVLSEKQFRLCSFDVVFRLDQVLEREPSNSAALCNHAALLRDTKNDQAGAESLLRRALMADGAHIPSLYNLATLLWDVHRDAIGAGARISRVWCKVSAYPALRQWLEQGEAEAAVTVFQNCVTAHPHATARNPDFLSDLAGTAVHFSARPCPMRGHNHGSWLTRTRRYAFGREKGRDPRRAPLS